MSNIRIKDIATTAASTASDDFIAIDGATNGTRKLDIYNPTIGGNITVSGTGNNIVNASGGNFLLGTTNNASNAKLNVAGPNNAALRIDQGGLNYYAASQHIFTNPAFATEYARFTTSSNLLLGTTTDGGQKLQVAGTASFTGTITTAQAAAGSTSALMVSETGVRDWGFYPTGGNLSIRPSSTGGKWSFNGNTPVELLNTTASSSTTTGALVVSGGVGIAGDTYLGGNLNLTSSGTISTLKLTGTGAIGDLLVTGSNAATGSLYLRNTSGNSNYAGITIGVGTNTGGIAFLSNSGSVATERMRLSDTNGNLLIGTTTDSGNGKLQLATHTTSAGGIGFGTDTSLYRSATGAGTLELNAASGSTSLLSFALAGTKKVQIGISASNSYFDYDGSLIFRAGVGGTTTLTLDSSQNATFAGLIGIAGNTLRGVGKVYNSATGDAYGMEQVSGSQNTGNQSRAAVRFFSPSGQGSEFDFGYYSDASTFNTHTRINTTGITTTGSVIVSNSQTPASASATGTTGTIAWDASYIYVCTATNTWKRVAIATW